MRNVGYSYSILTFQYKYIDYYNISNFTKYSNFKYTNNH